MSPSTGKKKKIEEKVNGAVWGYAYNTKDECQIAFKFIEELCRMDDVRIYNLLKSIV